MAFDNARPSFFMRVLAGYYGLLQVVHLYVLASGLKVYIQTGTIGFPALPPRTGWTEQAEAFLLGNGALDAIIAVAAIVFVFGFFKRRNWYQALGLVCLSGTICSGVFFIVGTYSSGAWHVHQVNYAGLVLVFTPAVFFFLMMIKSAWHTAPARAI